MFEATSHQNAIVTALQSGFQDPIRASSRIRLLELSALARYLHAYSTQYVGRYEVLLGSASLERLCLFREQFTSALSLNQRQRFAHVPWDLSPTPGVGLTHKTLYIPYKVVLTTTHKDHFWEWCLTSKETLWPNC